jgi:hypothetical protein
MSNPASGPLDCPSAQAGAKDARVYGVLTGTPDAPRVGYLTETQPVSEKLLALSGPAKPTAILRIAAPCEMSGCKHFKGNACTLAQRIVEGLGPSSTLCHLARFVQPAAGSVKKAGTLASVARK